MALLKQIGLGVALALVAGSAFAADITVTYIAPNSWVNKYAFKDIVAKWEAKTGNKVDIQAIPDEQYDGLISSRLAAGEGVDIFAGQGTNPDRSTLFVAVEGAPWETRILPAALAGLKDKVDGKIYGVPFVDGMSTYGVFYSKAAFDRAGITETPDTLAELEGVMKKLKDAGVTPLYISGKDGWTLLQHRSAVNGALQGTTPYLVTQVDHNTIQWSAVPGFMDQYSALEGWVKAGYVNADAVSATYDSALAAIGNGTTGMYFNGSWVLGDIAATVPGAEIGFFPLPDADGGAVLPMSPPTLIKVASFSQSKDAALDLLNFFVEPENATAALNASPGISAFPDAKTAHSPFGLAMINDFAAKATIVRGFDDASTMAQPQDDLMAAYQQLLDGRLDAAGFAAAVDATWVGQGQKDGIEGF